eukprot:gb/GFBE01070595.1/.p1 GENE.gb/GFBE01070595.1/~~gb/GFBE01070595.1/.p1  ORF type:complete len:608 (+),score=66.16 gb/GFBE01070595.1/:1-1824(+)
MAFARAAAGGAQSSGTRGGHRLSTTLRLAQLLLKAAQEPVPDSDDGELQETAAAADLLGGSPSKVQSQSSGSSSSLVVWLAAQAEQCPVPSCWRRLWDDRGRELFIHEYGVFPPQIVHPMLGYFVGMVSIVLLAGKGADEQTLNAEAEAFRTRIVSEAAELNSAYSGPLRSELGVDEWYCTETGWFTDVDPEESPRYLLQVLRQLHGRLCASAPGEPCLPAAVAAVTPIASRAKAAANVKQQSLDVYTECAQTSGRDVAPTPSTATPPSTGIQRIARTPSQASSPSTPQRQHSPLESAHECPMGSPLQSARAPPKGDSCNWFDVASPRGSRSPASDACSRAGEAEQQPDLETSYDLDWNSSAVQQSACKYFALDSAASDHEQELATPRRQAEGDCREFATMTPVTPESPDLEAAYGFDWNQPLGSSEEFGKPSSYQVAPRVEWSTPEAPHDTQAGPSSSQVDAHGDAVFSSPYDAHGCGAESELMAQSCSTDGEVRPQRLDFTPLSSPVCSPASATSGSYCSSSENSASTPRTPRWGAATYQDAVRVGVRKLFGDAFQKRREDAASPIRSPASVLKEPRRASQPPRTRFHEHRLKQADSPESTKTGL